MHCCKILLFRADAAKFEQVEQQENEAAVVAQVLLFPFAFYKPNWHFRYDDYSGDDLIINKVWATMAH